MIRPSHVNALFLTLNFRILGYFKQIFGEFECILGIFIIRGFYVQIGKLRRKLLAIKASNLRSKQLLTQQDKKH